MTVELHTESLTDHPLASIDAINKMEYQDMLNAWITGALDLTPGSAEEEAFNTRFQKLRAEQPVENVSAPAKKNRSNKNRKAGKHHGNSRR